jgi:hypothetical protein
MANEKFEMKNGKCSALGLPASCRLLLPTAAADCSCRLLLAPDH